MPTRTEILTIKDCALTLRHVGTTDAGFRPVLWLHGTDGLYEWPAIIDRLGERRYVIVPEHPGFGSTLAPGWMDDVSDLAYLYLDLLQRLDLPDVDIIGHSLGGWIAMEMAVRSTRQIGSLTLISAAGIHVKGVPKADIFMIDPDEQARLAYADSALGDAAAERARAGKYQEVAIANRVASARFGWNPRFHNPRLERWLSRIDVPALVVWGEDDRIFPPAHADALASAIPGAHLEMIANAGHLPHVERMPDVLATIDRHLTSGAASSGN